MKAMMMVIKNKKNMTLGNVSTFLIHAPFSIIRIFETSPIIMQQKKIAKLNV